MLLDKKELDENELDKSELIRKCTTRRNVTEPFVCNLKFSLEMIIVPKHSVSQYDSEPIEIALYIGAITVKENIYFYWNYIYIDRAGLLKITLPSLSFKSSLNCHPQTESIPGLMFNTRQLWHKINSIHLFCNLDQFIKLLILRVICYSRGCVILFIYICFLATNSDFLTQCLGPKIYQTMTFVKSNDFSLKYQKCTPVGHKIKI